MLDFLVFEGLGTTTADRRPREAMAALMSASLSVPCSLSSGVTSTCNTIKHVAYKPLLRISCAYNTLKDFPSLTGGVIPVTYRHVQKLSDSPRRLLQVFAFPKKVTVFFESLSPTRLQTTSSFQHTWHPKRYGICNLKYKKFRNHEWRKS